MFQPSTPLLNILVLLSVSSVNSSSLHRKKTDRRYLLLTGGTGLVGQYLLNDFLSCDTLLAVIVRSSKKLQARQRIESTMQRWETELGRKLPRPIVLVGNINEPMLGLSQQDQNWVANHCDSILHNAAVLKFSGSSKQEEPWKTNLGGTANVLKFAAKTAIGHLHYVSTAYVCGVRDTTVMEAELNVNQSFRNDYESSKFDAEMLVASATHFDTKTIYRPAVIVGDSQTGFTSTYHGMFLYLRLLSTLIPLQRKDENGIYQTPIKLPMTGDEPRNLVPVDWVSKVICHLVKTKSAHGRTFHLVPEQCSTTRMFIDACCNHFGSGGVEYTGKGERVGDSLFAKMFFQNARIYQDYETSDPSFDKTNLNKFAGHLECPLVDAAMIKRFIAFGAADKWGRRRLPRPKVPTYFGERCEQMVSLLERLFPQESSQHDERALVEIGMNVLGPGGGQWTLSGYRGEKFHYVVGLPEHQIPTLTIASSRLATLLEEFASLSDVPAGNQWDIFTEKFGAAMTVAH